MWLEPLGLECVASCGTKRSAGVAILHRPSLVRERLFVDNEGRLVVGTFKANNTTFQIASLYAPNRNPARDGFLKRVTLSPSISGPVVVAGDFNSVIDRTLDRRGSSPDSSYYESSDTIRALMTSLELVDGWRSLHPGARAYTWDKPDGSVSSRIDLVLLPTKWAQKTCSIIPCPFSDHRAVSSTFSLPDAVDIGPSFWKLNTSLLTNDEYREAVESFWSSWKLRRDGFDDIRLWWDVGKIRLRELSIKFSKQVARESRQARQDLASELLELKRQQDSGLNPSLQRIREVEEALRTLEIETARGALIRSRAKWVEEGETSSSYFLRMEKSNGLRRHITAIRDLSDQTRTTTPEILDAWREFYQNLFTATETDQPTQDELLDNLERRLDPEQASVCEGLITCEEALAAAKGMARGKTPGLDGLPVEFYLAFWPVLGTDLVSVLNFSFREGNLTISQRRGVISLIHKKDDPLNMKNWRPISLLTVDYKIATRCMAGRLLRVIGSVVAEDQTCGIPGRFIGDSVSLLRDVVTYVTDLGVPTAILSLDQEKAFDRVDWTFLFRTLEAMGFGPQFVGWIRLFYTDISSAVQVNGFMSSFFQPSRGVRQGCPISALLYVLVSEVLACTIRRNRKIVGVPLPTDRSQQAVISQYADDTSLICTSDDSICAVFETFGLYEKASGAKLNSLKSKGLWLGPWRHRTDPPVQLQWSSKSLRVLGAWIGPEALEEENFAPRLESLSRVLESWSQRNLSLYGKTLIVNSLALSGLWYCVSCLPVSSATIKAANRKIFSFLWSHRRELVSRVTTTQPRDRGGLGFPSVAHRVLAFQAQWIRRLADESSSKWKSFFTYFLDQAHLTGFLERPAATSMSLLPPFYRGVLTAWRAVGGGTPAGATGLSFNIKDKASPCESLTVKTAYQLLVQKAAQTPHCVTKFSPQYPSVDWPTAWKFVNCCLFDKPVTDFAWKAAHGVVYTADRLIGFGMDIEPNCFCSSTAETIQHLFFDCPFAQQILRWVQTLLDLFEPNSPRLTAPTVLYGFPAGSNCPLVFSYFMHVVKYYIWLARNDQRFRGLDPSAEGVIASIRARLRFMLPIVLKKAKSPSQLRAFDRNWCADGVVGRRSGYRLVSVL